VHKVKLKAIKFKADKELKAELSDMEFHRSKYRPHSAGLSEVEIDMELTKYFAENQLITRKDFQYLCGMTQITAYRHIKRLIAEKKLQNKGTTHQPIYTPVPGNYRVSVAVKYKE
jgi:putative DNA-binding protein